MAVTAFLVKLSGSRTSVRFIVVACSDATVTLRALVLPHRLWFDIALLVPSASPVLSLQHVVVPELQSSKDKSQTRNLFIVISGSTDGTATSKKDHALDEEAKVDGGGAHWAKPAATSETTENDHMQEQTSSNLTSSQEIDMMQHLHVLKNAHQSGVNCLHVSDARNNESCFSCYVVSGGDDQALHGFCFNVTSSDKSTSEKYQIVFSHPDKIASAHSSAVKGVWTDGDWVFSTGLDQRVRCWRVSVDGKLSEHAHLVVSVPEPEALDVSVCGGNMYQVAVAGRGMQMMEFSAPTDA
nr:hypothetical protein [Tanacetum cinerariifolium]